MELTDPVRLFYKASMKLLLVLLHDFPDFLCTYHFVFCDVIPPTCIQLRNVILSSFPKNMKLPDPFTPNLKVDLLPEITQPPQMSDKFKDAITPRPTYNPPIPIAEIDQYLQNKRPPNWGRSVAARFKLPPNSPVHYNVPLMNAVVLYLGASTIQQLQREEAHGLGIVESPAMDAFKEIVASLDSEGRYLFLNAMANQLRYPNNHTHYFSCVVLHLFLCTCPEQEQIQEQITRTLLERLIVNRPHPWGLLVTFIELVKNPRYEFWMKPFIHCTTEIERLFESVGHTCVGNIGAAK